jgi:hypothetical protein
MVASVSFDLILASDGVGRFAWSHDGELVLVQHDLHSFDEYEVMLMRMDGLEASSPVSLMDPSEVEPRAAWRPMP